MAERPLNCSCDGYDAMSLMAETAKLRRLVTKRGTLEILIPLGCTTVVVLGVPRGGVVTANK
jgi:hypothetical protein